MNSREFTFWLAGYFDNVPLGDGLLSGDITLIRAKMAEIVDEGGGFSDEEVENIKNSTIGIDRKPQEWWRNKFEVADTTGGETLADQYRKD